MKKVTIAGSGIKDVSHLTKEVDGHIKNSNLVIFSVNNPVLDYYIRQKSQNHISLDYLYKSNLNYDEIYSNMSKVVIKSLNKFDNILCLFYGHPTVFVKPTFLIIQQCKKLNIPISVLPGISSIDCLFADFRLDPLRHGCIIYDANYFLNNIDYIDANTPLILMQIGFINCKEHTKIDLIEDSIKRLKEKLVKIYCFKSISTYLYESNQTLLNSPIKKKINLNDLDTETNFLNKTTTLIIKPE